MQNRKAAIAICSYYSDSLKLKVYNINEPGSLWQIGSSVVAILSPPGGLSMATKMNPEDQP